VAVNRWISKAKKTAQVNMVTPVAANNATYRLIINEKQIEYESDATATVAEITAGLVAAWNTGDGADEGECQEITATDFSTHLLLTADQPGKPFTQTSSSTAGSLTTLADGTSDSVLNVSPNDTNNATNWTDGVPTAADDVIVDEGDDLQGLWWNLGAHSAVTVTSFTRRFGFTGRISNPEYNEEQADPFFEYRATEIAIGATTFTNEQPSSDEPGHVKWNGGAVQTTLHVLGDGGTDFGAERMWFRGTHVANVVNVMAGSLAIAPVQGSAATVATIRLEQGATVRCGSGCTLTTVTNMDSSFEANSSVTTYTQKGDNALGVFKGAAALTTANVQEGTLVWQSTGTITTLTPGPGSIIDFSQGAGAVTVTNAVTLPTGVTIRDPNGRVTWTNGLVLGTGVRLTDVNVDVGTARSITVA
jgi:hypothetical protein